LPADTKRTRETSGSRGRRHANRRHNPHNECECELTRQPTVGADDTVATEHSRVGGIL
jgi:hypothetical protein